jgi:hypothetical protein
MNKFWSGLLIVAIGLVFTSLAQAQATRTWVSGLGDDANPCSRTAPCKTFAGAISKTAAGGEIDCLDPGGFGTLTITKAITIDGGGGQVASALAGSGPGFTISAGASDTVILNNLRINGINGPINPGTIGIRVLSGRAVQVLNCYIYNFSQNGIGIESKTATRVFVQNTTISNCAGAGISIVTGDAQAAISDVSLIFNGTGLSAGPGAVTSFGNIVKYGNKNADR